MASSPESPNRHGRSEKTICPALPTDVLVNILFRLPFKDLCKFQCVSREWLSLMKDPHFISVHRIRGLSILSVFLVWKTDLSGEDEDTPLTMIEILGLNYDCSSNNIDFSFHVDDFNWNVEMLPYKGDLLFFVAENGFYACNPTTKVMNRLPDANCGSFVAGMGYNKELELYVLVNLFHRSDDFDEYAGYVKLGCEVLRLKDGEDYEWKTADVICWYPVSGWGVLVDNVFYWKYSDGNNFRQYGLVVSYDLEMEEFGTVELPETAVEPFYQWSLMEAGGKLCVLYDFVISDTSEMWVLKDPKNSVWTCQSRDNDTEGVSSTPSDKQGMPPTKELMDSLLEFLDDDAKKRQVKIPDRMLEGDWNYQVVCHPTSFKFGKEIISRLNTD